MFKISTNKFMHICLINWHIEPKWKRSSLILFLCHQRHELLKSTKKIFHCAPYDKWKWNSIQFKSTELNSWNFSATDENTRACAQVLVDFFFCELGIPFPSPPWGVWLGVGCDLFGEGGGRPRKHGPTDGSYNTTTTRQWEDFFPPPSPLADKETSRDDRDV